MRVRVCVFVCVCVCVCVWYQQGLSIYYMYNIYSTCFISMKVSDTFY